MLKQLELLATSIVEEWRAIGRRKGILIVILGLPIIYPALVSSFYVNRQAEARPAIVVDQDNSALSRQLALGLEATRDVRIASRPETLEEAFRQMRLQEAEMLVYFPPGFARQVKRGEQAKVRLWVNSANVYTYGLSYLAFYNVLLDANRELGQRALQNRGVTPVVAERRALPLTWEDRAAFQPTANYGDFLVFGVLLLVVQQLVLITLSFSVGWQREDGARLEAEPFPVTRLSGKALAHLAIHLAGIALIVFGIVPLFGWPMQAPWTVFALFVLLAVAMVPPAILVASLTPDRFAAFQLLMFFSAPVFMMSGFSWPLDQMPRAVQLLAWAFPATPALQALRVLSAKSGQLAAVLPQLKAMGLQFLAWNAIAVPVVLLAQHQRRRRPAAAGQVAPAPTT